MARGIREIKNEIDKLEGYLSLMQHPKVRELIEQIKKENAPRITELKKELEDAINGKKPAKARFPDNTPENVISVCNDYWKGSTASSIFRIHCWNDCSVWTSYPAQAWYCQGVRYQGKTSFYLLSLKETEYGRPKVIKLLDGRVSQKEMENSLATP